MNHSANRRFKFRKRSPLFIRSAQRNSFRGRDVRQQ
jgi:hypothetical protein